MARGDKQEIRKPVNVFERWVADIFAGLVNMMRGGSPNLSQKLMRWRVGLQFVAVIVILAILYFRQ